MKKIVILTGPTGVGKTKLSLRLAEEFKTDIINGDAFAVYDKMDILTAKPSKEEQSIVKHHLIDVVKPTDEFSVADYQKIVRNKVEELVKENKLPFIVGGSGLYVDSIYKDYDFTKAKRDDSFEKKYQDLTNEELFQKLIDINPIYLEKIEKNNRKRVLRALERELSGEVSTDTITREHIYDCLAIFLNKDREILYQNINTRVDEMFKEGLVEEVTTLYNNKEYSKTSMMAIGFKEFIPYFNKEITLEQVKEDIKKNSRHLAKRQFTWFLNQDNVQIIDNDEQAFEKIKDLIKKHLL